MGGKGGNCLVLQMCRFAAPETYHHLIILVIIISYTCKYHRHHSGDNHNKIPPWPTCCQVLSSQPVSEPDIHYDYGGDEIDGDVGDGGDGVDGDGEKGDDGDDDDWSRRKSMNL